MPSIMVNGKLATVDGVQVPVTTGCFADVVRYLESQKVAKEASKEPEVKSAEEAPKEEAPKEPEAKPAEGAPKEATPKAAAKAPTKPAEEAPKE